LFSDTTYYKLLNLKLKDAGIWSPPMKRVTPTKWDQELAPVHHTGEREPEYYMEWKKELYLHPTPDQGYTFEARYYSIPAAATGTGNTVPFDNLESVIENATTALCWSALEELGLAKHYMSLAQVLLKHVSDDAYTTLDFSAFLSYQKGDKGGTPWLDPFVKR
jgi:hypothetical protein